jgi:membrane associated rhomboid family serine protease
MDQFQLLMASPANIAVLIANIGLSIAAFGNVRLLDALMFDVGKMRRNREWYRWITSGFIHADPFHLFMNTGAFLGIYFATLLAASAWTWMEHFRDTNYRALGASGAISGITSATALFYPFATINLFFAIPMPLIVFAIGYIVWSAVAATNGVRDGIGHAAHLGGALAGVAIVCIFWPDAPQSMIDQMIDRIRGF